MTPVRTKIRARSLDLFHILSEGWVFPALISFLDCCIIKGSSFTILPLNSFVHMSVFVYLCEAFLEIEPHFDLFRHLFHLKPQPSSARLDVVGGVGIQLRQRMNRVYIPYKLSQKSDRLETKMVLCRKSWKQPSTHPSWPSRSAG